MAKFKKPGTRIKVAGIGVVTEVGLTDELARRLIDRNPAYASIITLEHTKPKAKAPSNDKKESKGGDSDKGGTNPKPIGAK